MVGVPHSSPSDECLECSALSTWGQSLQGPLDLDSAQVASPTLRKEGRGSLIGLLGCALSRERMHRLTSDPSSRPDAGNGRFLRGSQETLMFTRGDAASRTYALQGSAKLFKGHPRCYQLKRTVVSAWRSLAFLSPNDVKYEIQVDCILLWRKDHRYLGLLVSPPSFFGLFGNFSF